MMAFLNHRPAMTGARQPNDVDRRRIERALEQRGRYRYVEPRVHDTDFGYRIESPCCSRNIDPNGGLIDIALIEYADPVRLWRLYRKDHTTRQWLLHGSYDRLPDLLQHLGADPERVFWQ